MSSETQRQLSAGRMSDYCEPVWVEAEMCCSFAYEAICRPDVRKRPWPSTTVISHSPILDVEGRNPHLAQSLA